MVIYTIFTVIAIVVFGTNAQSNREKLQAKLLMANLTLSMIIGILGLWIIPFFDYTIPNVGASYHLIYALGLFFSVFYLGFMELKPSIIAEEIMDNIGDMVLLLGPDCAVLSANATFLETLFYSTVDLSGMPVRQLLHEKDDITPDIERLKTGTLKKIQHPLRFRLNREHRDEHVMTDTYLSLVADGFSDVIGYLMISHVSAGRGQFKTLYHITERELEIIDLTLEGLSSSEIGSKLGISARTVQSHQEHVYQKLGIASKVELVRTAHRFNL